METHVGFSEVRLISFGFHCEKTSGAITLADFEGPAW
jgi:hypothetical protein